MIRISNRQLIVPMTGLLFACACSDGPATSTEHTFDPPATSGAAGANTNQTPQGGSGGVSEVKPQGGITSTGGAATGGAPGVAGGGSSAGTSSAGAAGAAGAVNPPESLCIRPDSTAIPYDYSRGLSGEFAFELSMDCSLGGFLAPLVEIDPVNLTGVDAFVSELTDWLRQQILYCPDGSSNAAKHDFVLLPPSQSESMSRGDFEAAVTLFMQIVDRHDGLDDGFNRGQKTKIENRIRSLKSKAVKKDSDELTKPNPMPECAPDTPKP